MPHCFYCVAPFGCKIYFQDAPAKSATSCIGVWNLGGTFRVDCYPLSPRHRVFGLFPDIHMLMIRPRKQEPLHLRSFGPNPSTISLVITINEGTLSENLPSRKVASKAPKTSDEGGLELMFWPTDALSNKQKLVGLPC